MLQWAVQSAENNDVGLEIVKIITETAYEKDENVANYQNEEDSTVLHLIADMSRNYTDFIISFLMKEPYYARVDIKDEYGMNASARAVDELNQHNYIGWFME